MKSLTNTSRRAWQVFRALLGDDSYERYVAHLQRKHPDAAPQTRADFQRAELERRWSQVNRCC